jgi:hypothetical protein
VKQCPACKRSYADDTLRFCLEDGTELSIIDQGDPHRTEKFPASVTQAAHNAVRVDIPTGATHATSPSAAQPAKSGSIVLKILIAIVALAVVVVVAAAGLLGAFYYIGTRNTAAVDSKTQTPVPVHSPAASPYEITLDPDDENQKLEDKIKALQKKIEEAANSNSDTEVPWDLDDMPNVGRTAKVNSPNDGFLALRNLPSADIGTLVAKIPHGTTIKVLLCSEQSVSIDGRKGHWCMVSYNNKSGWVFDAWLEFQKS